MWSNWLGSTVWLGGQLGNAGRNVGVPPLRSRAARGKRAEAFDVMRGGWGLQGRVNKELGTEEKVG